jgi:hypothetical protein
MEVKMYLKVTVETELHVSSSGMEIGRQVSDYIHFNLKPKADEFNNFWVPNCKLKAALVHSNQLNVRLSLK